MDILCHALPIFTFTQKVRLLKIPLEGFIHKKGVSLAAVISTGIFSITQLVD